MIKILNSSESELCNNKCKSETIKFYKILKIEICAYTTVAYLVFLLHTCAILEVLPVLKVHKLQLYNKTTSHRCDV